VPPSPGATTLGPELERHGSTWALELGAMPIFHGLSVLSRALGDQVLEQLVGDRVDIRVERPILGRENPELREELALDRVVLRAERESLAAAERDPEHLQNALRTLFGTLQRATYRELLMAEPSTALVFHLALGAAEPARLVLERIATRDAPRSALRITIEDPRGRRTDLGSLPHVLVEEAGRRRFIAGSTRISQTLADGVRREAERGRRSFVERRRPHDHLFRQFDKAGMTQFEQVELSWGDDFVPEILEGSPEELAHALKRVLLALEDDLVRGRLAAREPLRIGCGGFDVWLDTTQLDRVLHLSFGAPRERIDIDAFLDRMPACREVAGRGTPLAGVSVFLVHHMTAEVLGLIAALRRLGCRDLVCQFVAYAGDPPGSYLAPLLDLPPDEFRALALVNIPESDSVEGHYRLSRQYSALEGIAELEAVLAHDGRSRRYLDAMRGVAVVTFLRQLEAARAGGRRLLLVEDGGYLAPELNRAIFERRTIGSWLGSLGVASEDGRDLRTELDGVLVGSVEHTRNGFNRLAAVEAEHDGLAWPAFSVAISRLKRDVESREVSTSVLNAVENVLHAEGRILSRRSCLVLGSRGAIGSCLMRALGARLDDPATQLCGVDLAVEPPTTAAAGGDPLERRSYRELPAARRRELDLVLGVVGESVLGGTDLEEWLLEGERHELLLASGSTKTEEFRELARWIEELLRSERPAVGGQLAEVRGRKLVDPLSGRLFGHRYELTLDGGARRRSLLLVANATPVNFLFYGVPTELIDEVLAQLLTASLGLLRRAASERLPARLLAVDRDIDAEGRDLE